MDTGTRFDICTLYINWDPAIPTTRQDRCTCPPAAVTGDRVFTRRPGPCRSWCAGSAFKWRKRLGRIVACGSTPRGGHMNTLRTFAASALFVATTHVSPLPAQTATSCAPVNGWNLVCGPQNPEDLVPLPGTR